MYSHNKTGYIHFDTRNVSCGVDDFDGVQGAVGGIPDVSDVRRSSRQRVLTEKAQIEHLYLLRNKATASLAAVTKCRNKLNELMDNVDNLHLVKTAYDTFCQLYYRYLTCAELYCSELEPVERQGVQQIVDIRLTSMHSFKDSTQRWIQSTERDLEAEVQNESVSATGSRKSRKSNASSSHKSSSTSVSSHTCEKAKLAGLLAERSLLHKRLEMEKTMQQTKRDIEEMKLDIAIAKTVAREKVFAEAEGQDYTTIDDLQSRESKPKLNTSNDTDGKEGKSSNTFPSETNPKVPMSSTIIDANKNDTFTHRHSSCQEPIRIVLNPDAKDFKPTPQISRPNMTQEYTKHTSLDQDINSSTLFVETQKKMVNAMFLPKPEVQKFQGDPTAFASFIMAFDARIIPHASSEADKLYYLNQHLKGEPQDLISGCLYMDTTVGYQSARELLFREYGDPYKVSSAYLNKVLSWPILKQDDYSGLKQFSYLLIKCYHVMNSISHMSVLNHAPHMQSIVQKLPQHLQTRWRDHVTRTRMDGLQYVGFRHLVDFIDFAARSANEPTFGKQALSLINDRPHKAYDTSRNKSYTTKSHNFATQVDSSAPNGRTHFLCYFCKQPHDIDDCKVFCSKSLADRRSYLMENSRCFGCYGLNHTVKGCMKKRKCRTCGKRHPTALHDDNFMFTRRSDPTEASTTKTPLKQVNSSTSCNSICSNINETILQPIIPVNVKQQGSERVVTTYALLDNGSTGCFITDPLRDQLEADHVPTALKLQTMNGTDFIDTSVVSDLIVSDIDNDHFVCLPRTFSRDVMPVEHDHIAKPDVLKCVPHLSHLAEKLPAYQPDLEIGLLIGCNCPEALQPLVVIPSEEAGTFAVCYKLGWAVNGPLQLTHNLQDNSIVCNRIVLRETVKVSECITPENVLRLFELDFNEQDIGKEPGERGYSVEDQRFIFETDKNVKFVDGHFQIPLPFRSSDVMPCNRQQALKRVLWQRKKMSKNEVYCKDYVAFMDSILSKGYAVEVSENELCGQPGHVWYLPHHGVYHPRKPNKIRVVFDCSARFNGVSLNDVLLQGPDLTNSLIGVLTRFRKEDIAFMGDVEAMFHQVKVQREQQDYLRFLWWPNGEIDGDLKEYRMTVHTFGTASSPSIANYALKASARKAENKFDPDVVNTIDRSFYVDDCLKSVQDEETAVSLISQLRSACAEGGFNLTKFTSNSKHVLSSLPSEHCSKEVQAIDLSCDDIPMERVLGMQWNIQSDSFKFSVDLPEKPATRRGILSTMSSLYDPLGLVSPVVLPAKKILQDLCKDKCLDWDDKVGKDCCDAWKRWLCELELLRDLEVRRCFKPKAFGNVVSRQLHIFSDASVTGYGCAAYIRLCSEDNIHTTLVMGKARLAPLKITTIPRLELTAATTAVKIGAFLLKEMDMEIDSTTYYTDSTTVLHFITNEQNRYPVFVANRVKLIRDFTDPQQWKYIDSKSNPADIASRGISCVKLLKSSTWFEGPQFLRTSEEEWPKQPSFGNVENSESFAMNLTKTVSGASALSEEDTVYRLIQHYSSWYKLQRAVAIYRRFFTFLKYKAQNVKVSNLTSSPFTVQELSSARGNILKFVQQQEYQAEINFLMKEADERGRVQSKQVTRSSPLYKLNPVVRNGMLCVGGRLSRANIPEDTKYPIILPQKNHVSLLIIKDIHERLGHVGRNHVLSSLRAKFWITKANSAIRSVLNKCVFCRRFKTPTSTQMMSDLPACRVNPAYPFSYTGIDFFGPHVVKEGRKYVKRYGVLFTCLSSRAVHIETANSLDTSSFINSLRRFIARRGPVKEIFCDNGTNFVGGARELKESFDHLDRAKIHSEMLHTEINFNFNPPSASHMGGVWERLIRSVRNILNPMLHEFGSYLDDELYRTLLCEIEAILNSRPLTTVSGDPNDLEPLTPNHLLMMKPDVFIPPPGTFQQNHLYSRQRWKCIQYLANIFWSRWKKEYLQSLQQRQKWNSPKRNFQLNDIVLIKDDTLPRSAWSMGRVIQTEVDTHGMVRSVLLRARGGELRRPIHKLVLLLPSGSA